MPYPSLASLSHPASSFSPTVASSCHSYGSLILSCQLTLPTAKLSPGWYHIRTPVGHEYSLTAHPGQLALFPGGFRLDDYECPSALLRKQITLQGTWTTRMHFQPGSAYEEAGSVMYVSAVAYVALFVRLAKEGEGEGEGERKGEGEGKGRRVMVVRYPEGGSGFKVCLLGPSAAYCVLCY